MRVMVWLAIKKYIYIEYCTALAELGVNLVFSTLNLDFDDIIALWLC